MDKQLGVLFSPQPTTEIKKLNWNCEIRVPFRVQRLALLKAALDF
jgi:hypothetical protein